jgi:hypothetical protein
MEAFEKTAALHDVPERKRVSLLAPKCLNTLSHSNTKSSLESSDVRRKKGLDSPRYTRKKGVMLYGQKVSTLYLIQIQRVGLKVGSREEGWGGGSPRCIRKKRG